MSDATQVRRAALAYLARRDFSQQELTNKLLQKNYSLAVVKALVAEFTQKAWLDDEKYAANYIRMRRKKGYGPNRIRFELAERGIDADIIARQLDIHDNAWQDDAYRIWQKHFKSKHPAHYQEKCKQMRFLHYRGFATEHIEAVFKNFS